MSWLRTPRWALLPLIATQRLGLGAGAYGALFAALGVCAVAGGVGLGPLRERLSTNGMLGLAMTAYSTALAVLGLTRSFVAALAALLVAGVAWVRLLMGHC
jgi:hypothetical protein